MKVYIGPYKSWFGPYQLADKLCFWAKPVEDSYGFKDKPHWVHQFGEWLAHGSIEPNTEPGDVVSFDRERHNTWLYKLLLWLDSKKQRKVEVRIDRYDTWGMAETLALIILPMLKQFRASLHGSPFVDDTDVPEYLRSTVAPPKKDEFDIDDNHHKRWEWVLDEIIFAFESKVDDSWEDQFVTGISDHQFVKLDNGCSQMTTGPNHTYKVDYDNKKIYEQRIQNGFNLFGKYFQNLWD